MEVHPLLHQLDSLLAGEVSRPRPGAPVSGQATISPGMRDGSAHVLRCLKVWYDLPSDVFHTALANIDTFLAKMKVSRTLCTTRAVASSNAMRSRCAPRPVACVQARCTALRSFTSCKHPARCSSTLQLLHAAEMIATLG